MMPLIPAALLAFVVTATPQIIVPAPLWDVLPTDVSGTARGLYALHVDAAAAGDMPGAALQVRHVGTPGVRGTGALGLSVGAPLGPLTIVAGYTWGNLPNPKTGLSVVGLSWRLSERLRLGVNIERLKPLESNVRRTVLDAGVLWVPHRTVSLSLGVDAANAPAFSRHVHMRRALRLGLGVRPLYGDPWLTLGVDARMSYANGAHMPDARAIINLAPYEGLHVFAAYQRRPQENIVWAGLSANVFGAELLGAGRAVSPVSQSQASRMAWALTLQHKDRQTMPLKIFKEVHVDITGDLKAGATAPWRPQEALALLPARLARLADADDVSQVTLHVGDLEVGYATVQELRAAIGHLRAAGKTVLAHLQVADTKGYLVAAATQHITMDPVGTLDLKGPSVRHYYLADALKAVGLRFEAVAVGRYKSAPNMFTQNSQQDDERRVSCAIVDEIYEEVLAVLMHDRKLSAAAAHEALAAGPLSASRAQRLSLVDEVAIHAGGTAAQKHPQALVQGRLEPPAKEPIWGAAPRIAIVALTGILSQDNSQAQLLGAQESSSGVVRALARAGRDPEVKGVVLRIDSPGGDVMAAEEIYRAVQELARHKPVAASMGDVAASGGYWAALAAPMIFAEPLTVTGSIGIYNLKVDASGLLAKLGVNTSSSAAGERAGAGGWQEGMSEGERAHQQQHLGDLYAMFVDRVAQSRHLTPQRASDIAQGRVYTGHQAHELHLVDAMGGLFDAIAWVSAQAGVAQDEALAWQVPHRRLRWPGPLGVLSYGAQASKLLAHPNTVVRGPQAIMLQP